MIAWITENTLEIFLTLLTTGALGLCAWFGRQIKNYKVLLKEEEEEKTREMIEEEIQPILAELEELRKYINNFEVRETTHVQLIISSWRYRLIQLCKIYQKQGFMTLDQYEQLSELYHLYRELGGNGQAETYYNKTCELPTRD